MEINALDDLVKLIRSNKKLGRGISEWAETIAKTAYQLGRMDGVNEMSLMMSAYGNEAKLN